MLESARQARKDCARSNGDTKGAWHEAWRLHPDPSETDYNRARIAASEEGSEIEWIGEALLTPLTRAARNFADAVKASRGLTRSGIARKVKAGPVQPRGRREDARAGLEWQIQGKMPLNGKALADVVDAMGSLVKVPSLGDVRFSDRCRLLKSYLAIRSLEVCETTVKRDGNHFYACINVRGLPAATAHQAQGRVVGIDDMGVANPLATSDGELVAFHQGHDISGHLERLERRKLRAKRHYARKLRAAAERAGALSETGSFKKGVAIPSSNRMRRLLERQNKIDRQIVGYRADWQRKRALEIVRHSEIVIVEALSVRSMTRSPAGTLENPGRNVRAVARRNRSILARGFGTMRARLRSKAEELGGQIIEVDPAFTSQECPKCGHVGRDNRRAQAEFACISCGLTEHADIVGAINILRRGISAGAPPAAGRGGHATGTPPSGGNAERAAEPGNRKEPSNKSVREPAISAPDLEDSRIARLHNARKDLLSQLSLGNKDLGKQFEVRAMTAVSQDPIGAIVAVGCAGSAALVVDVAVIGDRAAVTTVASIAGAARAVSAIAAIDR
jgi:putative transposase